MSGAKQRRAAPPCLLCHIWRTMFPTMSHKRQPIACRHMMPLSGLSPNLPRRERLSLVHNHSFAAKTRRRSRQIHLRRGA